MNICPGCGLPKNVCTALASYNRALMCITVQQDIKAAVTYFHRAIEAEMAYYSEREAAKVEGLYSELAPGNTIQ